MSKITYADKVALNTNTEIPAQNKVEDTDMNNIKGAVNEIGKYNTATAGTNGDFNATLKGTLSSGDIVRISFPTATVPTSNARLSIDGGTTYKNVFFGIQLLASEIENTNQTVYYDGTQWQLSNKKNTITAYLNANKSVTIGSTFTAYLLEIPAQYQVSGNKITYDSVNKCVKIGAGITKVKISASIMIKGIIGTPIVGVRMNRGGTYTSLIETYGSKLPDTTGYVSFSQAPSEVLVQENDLIELYVSSSATGTFTIAGTSRLWTYLTVEEV